MYTTYDMYRKSGVRHLGEICVIERKKNLSSINSAIYREMGCGIWGKWVQKKKK